MPEDETQNKIDQLLFRPPPRALISVGRGGLFSGEAVAKLPAVGNSRAADNIPTQNRPLLIGQFLRNYEHLRFFVLSSSEFLTLRNRPIDYVGLQIVVVQQFLFRLIA